MGIDRLRYFAAVVETGNLRKASELTGISPPSMSKAIAVLEAELGHKLIRPEGRGIGITAKGIEIYHMSSSLLEEYQRFHQNLKTAETRNERLRIASFEVFSSYFISAFLETEKEQDLLLLEMTPGRIEETILAGAVDIGITYIPSPNTALEYIEIGSFNFRIFGSKRWEDKEFDEWPFAIPTTEMKIHSSEIDSLDMWPKSAPRRRIKYHFEMLETALQTSRRGLCVLHCPDFIVHLHNEHVKASYQLFSLRCPEGYKNPRPTKVFLVGRKGQIPKGLEGKFARLMRSFK